MNDFINEYESKMGKTLAVLENEYAAVRAGRANPALLDKIKVSYYDVDTPINQLASMAVSEARTLVITPWDKSTLKTIEKALQVADIGINPQNDGSTIRLVFPQLTEERRKELCKQIAKMGEDSKVAVRSIRRDANDKLKNKKKSSEMPEDVILDLEDQIQKLTDKFCKKIDDVSAAKEKEIMEV